VLWRGFSFNSHRAHRNFTPNVIPCRVLAPGAWNLPVRATVSNSHSARQNLTLIVIPCRVLAPGAWNLPVRATVSNSHRAHRNLTLIVIPCRVLAPGAWNLPARVPYLTRTAHAENAEMVFKRRLPIYSNRCEMPSISHRCAQGTNAMLHYFQLLLPTSCFILPPSSS